VPTLARFTRLPVLAVTYALLRASVVWGLHPATFPDSAGYQRLDLSSPVARTWPVPSLYSVVRSDPLRVGLHVILGAMAWTWLAHTLSRNSRFPAAVAALTFLIGLTPQVVRYDLTILSESLAITFGVAMAAATLAVADGKSPRSITQWVLVMTVFSMVRPQHMIVLFAAAAFVLARSVGRRALPGAIGLVVLAVSVFGFVQFRANRPTSELNLYTVVVERVLNDDARFSWFVRNGMPDIPGMREAQSYDYVEQVPPDVLAFLQLPIGQAPPSLVRVGGMAFAQWVRTDGWSTYARYVVTHPADTRARITDLASPTLDPVNGDFLPLQSRTIVPRWLFLPWKLSCLLVAAGTVFAVLTGRLRRAGALGAMFLTTATIYSAAMLTSGIEHPRHASMVAVLLRVCALAGVAELLRRDVSSGAPSDAAPGA